MPEEEALVAVRRGHEGRGEDDAPEGLGGDVDRRRHARLVEDGAGGDPGQLLAPVAVPPGRGDRGVRRVELDPIGDDRGGDALADAIADEISLRMVPGA